MTNQKYDEKDRSKIIKMRNAGMSYKEIKTKTGISTGIIYSVLNEAGMIKTRNDSRDHNSDGVSDEDLKRKEQVKHQLLNTASMCFVNKECGNTISILCFKWSKCSVCREFLPVFRRKVIKELRTNGFNVIYLEKDIRRDGNEEFIECRCQGTPCVLVKDPKTGKYKKVFEGAQKEVAAISMILGLPNPLYYDIKSTDKPQYLLQQKKKKK